MPQARTSHFTFVDELPSSAIQVTTYKTKKNTHTFNSLFFDPTSGKFYCKISRIREITSNTPNSIIARNTNNRSVRISFKNFQKVWNEEHPDQLIDIYIKPDKKSKKEKQMEEVEDEA